MEVAAPVPAPAAPATGMKLHCAQDLARFCAGVAPGQGRLVDCLARHAPELSPACAQDPGVAKRIEKAALPPLPEVPWDPGRLDKARLVTLHKACVGEERRLCSEVKGGHGRVLNCLWSHWDKLGEDCRQASEPVWRAAAALQSR